ncbi:Odorant receptor 401 [Nylanderia fulva]|uniref:Odorant receptor 401 n=1 Tax=Nylanderia fulva TaxID=613905 RepID=A0A6G1LPG1_9HYME|nr:Odorant receptor 401 [Nylanderia fulva]
MAAQKSISQSRYYALPRIFTTLIRLWPYQTIGKNCLRFTIYGLYLLNDSIDIDDVFESVPAIVLTIVCSVQLIIMIIHSEKIKTCFKKIEGDWLSLNTEIEKTISQRHTKYGQSMTKIYSENGIENTTKSSSSKISSLPYNVEYAMYSHFIIIVAVDSLFYTVIQHICRMFSIIGHMLENIGKNNDANFRLEVKKIDDDNYDIALDCLRRHLHLAEFAKLLESLFANMFLFTIYAVILSSTISGRWYYTSRRCRKILLLILNRTMTPCKITAGNLMTLSIENYGAVLKTSMSYFTMLRSFQ